MRPNEAEAAGRVIDGEAIIINLTNGMYYSLDGPGGFIWEPLARGHSLDEVAGAVSAAYDVPAARALTDVEGLATELLEEKLLLPSNGDAGLAPLTAPETRASLPYDRPQLMKYGDRSELLALDPPLPGLPDIPWQGTSERASGAD